jgi:hypothetical protein
LHDYLMKTIVFYRKRIIFAIQLPKKVFLLQNQV